MSLKFKFLRGGVLLSTGYAGQQALVFLRNVLVARLIGPDDFGVAVTFVIILTALEVISDLGVEQYIVRARDGEDPGVQSTLQTVLIVRGLLISAGIFLVADFTAQIFGVPDAVWVYQWLAVIPAIKSFMHLDIRRMQRNLAFLPGILAILLGAVAGFTIAVTLGFAWRSYESMLWAFIGEAIVMVAVSHMVAKRSYALSMTPRVLRALCSYGWPLMLNGLILFLMSQGDRLIIGADMGVRELANYAVAVSLTASPALLILKITGALYVPLLSSGDISTTEYARRYELCGALTALAAFLVAIPLIYYGVPVAALLYGREYDLSMPVMAWLAVASGARILRSWPLASAIADGRTRDVLYTNLFRVLGFAAAIVALYLGYGVTGVAFAVALGELIALLFALDRSDRSVVKTQCGRQLCIAYLAIVALVLIVVIFISSTWGHSKTFLSFVLVLSLAVGSITIIVGSFRSWITETAGNAMRKTFHNKL